MASTESVMTSAVVPHPCRIFLSPSCGDWDVRVDVLSLVNEVPLQMSDETLKQDIVRELDRLPPETLREVRDFIDVLVKRDSADQGASEATREEASDVTLEEPRERLSTIEGSMAQTISDMREVRV
jgi:hypothetical protein